ncbi:MAG: chloride channel protein [Planctomycetota bacterium]|jgi:CIC family chloride channel protein|nr:chloride channel protein [Planctomycetota bacterium]
MPTGFERAAAPFRPLAQLLQLQSVSKWVVFASVIGVAGGLVGAAFHWLLDQASDLGLRAPAGLAATSEGLATLDHRAWLLVAIPALGGLLTGVLVARFSPESGGHGTDSVIEAYHRLRGVMRARVIFLKALTSAITIGSGGSAGQEGPIAQVGSGLGSSAAAMMGLSDRDRRILLLCGSSAGIGAVFCSPLGGALFMPEVLYRKSEFEGDAMVPCIISSIMAYATFTTITGRQRALELPAEVLGQLTFDDPRQLALYLVLAILCTIVGLAYTRIFYGVHGFFGRARSIPLALRPAVGGLLLGATALAISPVAGDRGVLFGGYGLMLDSIQGSVPMLALCALVVAKIIATSFTVGSGGSGGVFAPSLAIGAMLGAAVGQGAEQLFPALDVHPAAFALVGMGGFFAGVAKVPVAAVVMVCEMTGGYELLAPLMFVSVLHLLLSQRWSLYEAQVSGVVDSPAHAGDFVVDVLERISVRDVFAETRAPQLIHQDTTLRRVLHTVSDAKESYFPVVDDDGLLVGIFSLTDLRRIYLEDVAQDVVIVRDFMIERVVTARMDDSLDEVVRNMTAHNINAIPIVEGEEGTRVLALMERNDLSRAYSRRLQELRAGA